MNTFAHWFVSAAWVALCFCCQGTHAAAASGDDLSALVRAARTSFWRPSPEQFDEKLAALQTASDALDQYLATQGANGAAWEKYLRWETLAHELKSKQPSASALAAVDSRFSGGQPGLEMPVFADVRHALDELLPAARVAGEPAVKADFNKRLDELAGLLSAASRGSAGDDTATDQPRQRIGEILGWLEDRGQAADLVAAARRQLSHPNLLLSVSRPLLASEVDEPIEESGPVQQNVLGMAYSGTARTVGRVELALVPDSQQAVFEIRFSGNSDGNTSASLYGNRGRQRGTVYSQTVTNFQVQKRLEIDSSGVRIKPSQAQANITSDRTSVDAGWIAQRRADDSRGQAEQASARTTERDLSTRLDRIVSQLLEDLGAGVPAEGGTPLAWRRPGFPQLHFSTTDEQLEIIGTQADRFQLAAGNEPPKSLTADLAVRLHESWLNNRGQSVLASKTLAQQTLQPALTELLGSEVIHFETPAAKASERSAWSMVLAAKAPLAVRFGDRACAIQLAAESFKSGTGTYPAMHIRAKYRLDSSPGRIRLVLEGKVQVYPPGFVPGSGQRLGGRYQTYRRALAKQLATMFPAEIALDRLRLDKPLPTPAELNTIGLSMADGWLVAGFAQGK